jgi:hypothetical protein
MDLPPALIQDMFRYEPDGRVYRNYSLGGRCRPITNPVGNPDGGGHLRLKYKGRSYSIHRIVWIMHHGPIPTDLEIDHINRIRTDNRIENLRAVTHLENCWNQSNRIDNTTGTSGVQWNGQIMMWTARLAILHVKNIYLGSFKTKEEAIAARRAAEVCMRFHFKGKASVETEALGRAA